MSPARGRSPSRSPNAHGEHVTRRIGRAAHAVLMQGAGRGGTWRRGCSPSPVGVGWVPMRTIALKVASADGARAGSLGLDGIALAANASAPGPRVRRVEPDLAR